MAVSKPKTKAKRKPMSAAAKKALVERLQAGRKKAGLKSTAKKAPAKRKAPAKKKVSVTRSPKVMIKVVTAGNKIGYVCTATSETVTSLDTLASKAKHFAESTANKLATSFFNDNKKYLKSVQVVPVKKQQGTGYKKNPVPASQSLMVKEAATLYEDFTGHEAEFADEYKIKVPKVALQFGKCDGIMYETVRDGKTEHYVHKFKKSARPIIGASHDGTQLVLVGGNYQFTNRGIVDH